MMEPPFCPFLTSASLLIWDRRPQGAKHKDRPCRGSACACWDPNSNDESEGRCGIAKGFNFHDPHKPPVVKERVEFGIDQWGEPMGPKIGPVRREVDPEAEPEEKL